jgi:hypothetical protein
VVGFRTSDSTLALPSRLSFRRHFPLIARHERELGDSSLAGAIRAVRGAATEPLEEHEQTVMGTRVRGQYVAYVGPVALACTLLYLLAYLLAMHRHVAACRKDRRRGQESLTWIGTAEGGLPGVIALLTIAVMPSVATWASIARLLLNEAAGWVAAVVVAGVGLACVTLARRIATARCGHLDLPGEEP